jgi:hypothetical protein
MKVEAAGGVAIPSLTVSRSSILTGAGLGCVAAVLRWFHNYHFDDLPHLVYLTELARTNLMPPKCRSAYSRHPSRDRRSAACLRAADL